jgi:hypothetical protein
MPRRCELQEHLAVVEAEESGERPSEQISKSLKSCITVLAPGPVEVVQGGVITTSSTKFVTSLRKANQSPLPQSEKRLLVAARRRQHDCPLSVERRVESSCHRWKPSTNSAWISQLAR